MNTSNRILLNPKNEAYISGKSQKVGRPSLWSPIGMTLLGVLFLVATLVLVDFSAKRLMQSITLSQSGRQIQATIIDREQKSWGKGPYGSITYQFQVEGHTYTKQSGVSGRIFNVLAQADKLTITYLPSDPDISMLSGQNAQIGANYIEPVAFPVVALLATMLMLIGGFTDLRDVWQSSARLGRLEKDGKLLYTGRIVHVALKPVWDTKGQQLEGRITYCFTDARGSAFTRRLTIIRKNESEMPAVGSGLVILYRSGRDYEVL
jgi:hypothetical protein